MALMGIGLKEPLEGDDLSVFDYRREAPMAGGVGRRHWVGTLRLKTVSPVEEEHLRRS